MPSFIIGQEYERSQLLAFVGSKQQQTGVIWGKKESGCIILTSGGRHGKKVGYSDESLKDGCWWYFGQGQSGDHATTNPANAKLIDGQPSILLFTTREPTASEVALRGNYKKLFAFQGTFNVSYCEVIIPASGTRKGHKLLRFFLVPADNSDFHLEDLPSSADIDILSLRQQLISQIQNKNSTMGLTLAEYRRRSTKVRRYAILRANGKCEACGCLAPFLDDNGNGFLEVHHMERLADDGIDAPQNVAAICPNCHRRAHYSTDRESFRLHLLATILNVEDGLATSGCQTN